MGACGGWGDGYEWRAGGGMWIVYSLLVRYPESVNQHESRKRAACLDLDYSHTSSHSSD